MPIRTTTRSSRVLRAILFALCLAVLWPSTVPASSSPASESTVDGGASTQSGADEDLYLCYLLPVLYQQAFVSEEKLKDAEARDLARDALQLAWTIREHAKTGKVDRRVERLYADLLAVAELREKSLRSANRAASAVRRQNEADSYRAASATAGKAAGAGYAAHSFTKSLQEAFRNPNQKGTPDEELFRIGVGVVAALGSAAYDTFNDLRSTRDQEASVREHEMSELKRFCDEVDARQRVAIVELIKERGWQDVEPPGEAQTRRIERYQRAIASQRQDELLLAAREALAANPRNYFLCLEMEEALAAKTNRTSSELIDASRRLVQASRLVPEAPIYDDHRLVALQSSGILCSLALGQESSAAGERWEPNATSEWAVTTLEDLCRRLPQDQLPAWNLLRAFAYLSNRRLTDAEALVPGLRENEAKLATLVPQWVGAVDCLQAGIQSIKGDAASGLSFLRKAVATGAPVSKDWWKDADYRAIRTSHPKEFAELLAVKAAWTIEYGILNDDVIVQNNSGFNLSGLHLRVRGRSGAKEVDVQLLGERIPKGETMRWKNVLSIPKDPGLKVTLEFNCDQAPSITAADFVVPR